MQALFIVILVALAAIFISINQAGLALLTGIVLLADLAGGLLSGVIGALFGTFGALKETAQGEAAEVEAAKVKYPSGKKAFEEGFGRLCKEFGKREKDKQEGKMIKSKLNTANLAASVENFLAGIGKALKK